MGTTWKLYCKGYEAFWQRNDSDGVIDKAVKAVSGACAWPLYFLLRCVDARFTNPVAVRILCGSQYRCPQNPATINQVS